MSSTAKLGQLLLDRGWLSAEQLKRALANQVTYGGRLGTNIVELGLLQLERVAEALGLLFQVPVATVPMLEAVDSETLRLTPPAFCAAKGVLPLSYDGQTLHLAMLDPNRAAEVGHLSRSKGLLISPYAVPQLRLLYYLERHYGIPRAKRYLRVADGSQRPDDRRRYLTPTVPHPATGGPDAIDDLHLGRRPQPSAPQPDVTGPAWPAAEPALDDYPSDDDGLVFLDQVVRDRPNKPEVDIDIDIDIDVCFEDDDRVSDADVQPIEVVLESIARARTRDEVIGAMVQPIHAETSLNVVFMRRGDLGVAVTAWGTDVKPPRLGALVIPLDSASLVTRAIDGKVVVCTQEPDRLQQMIAVYLHGPPPEQVCVTPILIDRETVNLLCTQTSSHLPSSAVRDLTRLAHEAQRAFARIIAALD